MLSKIEEDPKDNSIRSVIRIGNVTYGIMLGTAKRIFRIVLIFTVLITGTMFASGLSTVKPLEDQIHLSLTGDPTQMEITWVTSRNSNCGYVEYGLSLDNYNHKIIAVCSKHSEGHWWEPKWLGKINKAKFTNLLPNTVYHYRIIGEDGVKEYQFTSAPDGFENFNFAVVGDQGISSEAQHVVNSMLNHELDLLLMPGDLSYASTGSGDWDQWFNMVEPLAAKMPLQVAIGNHDRDFGFNAFETRFSFPTHMGGNEYYNSFNYGSVHFISLSSEHSIQLGSPQYQWLENDLLIANSNRSQHPWIVVQIHAPLYSSSHHGSNLKVRTYLEPLFDKYDVDLMFAGHDHSYERTFPVKNAITSESKTVYVLTGTGGRRVYRFSGEQPSWSAKRIASHGFTKIQVVGDQSILLQFIDINGNILDTYEMNRSVDGQQDIEMGNLTLKKYIDRSF